MEVEYADMGSGLQVNGTRIEGFELSDDGVNFQAANAVINGNRVVIDSLLTRTQSTIWYSYKNTSIVNLFNSTPLPALSFEAVITK